MTSRVLEGDSLYRAIREAIGRFLDLERDEVFLFGSEAAGTGKPRSDIDVGILGSDPIPGAVMQRIRDDLESLRTLRLFDVVDFRQVDESFKAVARRHVRRI